MEKEKLRTPNINSLGFFGSAVEQLLSCSNVTATFFGRIEWVANNVIAFCGRAFRHSRQPDQNTQFL